MKNGSSDETSKTERNEAYGDESCVKRGRGEKIIHEQKGII